MEHQGGHTGLVSDMVTAEEPFMPSPPLLPFATCCCACCCACTASRDCCCAAACCWKQRQKKNQIGSVSQALCIAIKATDASPVKNADAAFSSTSASSEDETDAQLRWQMRWKVHDLAVSTSAG